MRSIVLLVLLAFVACGSETEESVKTECTPFQFRACLAASGQKGTQQCLQNGAWSPCFPSVYDDASYAEHDLPEAAAETGDDGGEDAADVRSSDADLDGDAAEASLLD